MLSLTEHPKTKEVFAMPMVRLSPRDCFCNVFLNVRMIVSGVSKGTQLQKNGDVKF